MYRILLNNEEIGTPSLEMADPPMGVVIGKISFLRTPSPFHLFLAHCREHNIIVNSAEPEDEFIETQVIPQLRVLRTDGVEIRGQGCCISGFKEDGYHITILGIPYPFFGEEFPHHRKAYDERFRSKP
jgi:hypothetical protein